LEQYVNIFWVFSLIKILEALLDRITDMIPEDIGKLNSNDDKNLNNNGITKVEQNSNIETINMSFWEKLSVNFVEILANGIFVGAILTAFYRYDVFEVLKFSLVFSIMIYSFRYFIKSTTLIDFNSILSQSIILLLMGLLIIINMVMVINFLFI